MPQAAYRVSSFSQLSLDRLYAILQLRAAVFVVEQNCPYQDLDGLDAGSLHLEQRLGGQLVGYTRLLPPGLDFKDACAIGRVLTDSAYRKQGLGKALMQHSIAMCTQTWPNVPIKIKAQTYLLDFYTSLDFQPFGKTFLEDGIPHIAMVLNDVG